MDVLIKLIVGGLFALVVIKIGFWMLRGLANPLPAPPPAAAAGGCRRCARAAAWPTQPFSSGSVRPSEHGAGQLSTLGITGVDDLHRCVSAG